MDAADLDLFWGRDRLTPHGRLPRADVVDVRRARRRDGVALVQSRMTTARLACGVGVFADSSSDDSVSAAS